MPITGKFVADFTDFDRGVQGAIPKLVSFQTAADRAGGRLMDLGNRSSDASPKIGTLATSLKTFDGALASMGVHIGPEIRALGELGAASGKTASQLGMVTTAGLALAAGIGGWKIGRLIADFTGSDKAIGDMVASMMGWTDAAERAGAKTDVLALATKNAGREITDMREAIKINAAALTDWQRQMMQSADVTRDGRAEVAGWQRELREIRKEGNLPQLTIDLESQNFSLKTLAARYGTTVEALQYFTRQQKAAADETKKSKAVVDELAESYRKLMSEVNNATGLAQMDAAAATIKRAADNLDGIWQMEQDAHKLAWKPEPVVDWLEVVGEAPPALEAVVAAAGPTRASVEAMGGAFMAMGAAVARTNAEIMQMPRNMRPGENPFETEAEFTQRRVLGMGRTALQGFAGGGPVMRDGPIYAHAGEYVVPKGGGGGVTNIYITQPLGTPSQIAAAVKQALAQSHMTGGGRMPA